MPKHTSEEDPDSNFETQQVYLTRLGLLTDEEKRFFTEKG
jgi:hypothetical protein